MCLENKLKEIKEIIKNVRSGGRPIGHYTFTLVITFTIYSKATKFQKVC